MWKKTEARMNGQTSAFGTSTKGSTTSAAAPMPSVISVIDRKRSRCTLTSAFQIACMAAAESTARKTNSVMPASPARQT
ncbi:hypothetical protein ACVOMV_00645 [Mesorhizobium atlanticum]